MRVISGSARGTKLLAPEGVQTRPTADRSKETLFNMIAFDIADCCFLDLFCGSGSIGIEALSRGASHATFVDNNSNSIKITNKNLEKTRLQNRASVREGDCLQALGKISPKPYSFVFMDPPYESSYTKDILIALSVEYRHLLTEDACIITEIAKTEVPFVPPSLEITKEKIVSYNKFIFYRFVDTENKEDIR